VSEVVIVGASELARLALSFLREVTTLKPVACAVAEEYRPGAELGDLPVVALEELRVSHPPSEYELLVCLGYRRVNRARQEVTETVRAEGYQLASLLHPASWISPDAELGDGCIVFPGTVVEPFATVGAGGILWSGSVVAHDTRVGDFCFLAPNATVAGNVTLGDRCFVGANATVRDGIVVGTDCIIGAGAVVKHDTESGTVYSAAATRPGPQPSASYDTV